LLSEVSSWLVWLLPLISSAFVPLIARLGEKARNGFVITVSAVTTALAFLLIPAGTFDSFAPWVPSSGINAGVFIDPLSILFSVLIAFFGLIIAIYSLGYMKGEEGLTRYYFFLLLFIGSMIGLVVSDNFLQMFIFWEMVGLCSYSLISFWHKRPEAVRAGTKVFLMTRIGDISLLAAIGVLYASLGTFSFHSTITAIQNGALSSPTIVVVAFLVLGGAIAKSAQLPLFTWLYSAMEAPTSVSALLHAATMVKAGIYLIARFILIAAPMMMALQPLWLPTLAWIGVLTALIGATLALSTPDIKGVLAYSTVSQLGFMMAALGASGAAASSSLGWFASLFHMMSHAFFEGLGFLLAGGIIHALGTRDMRLMGGLRKAMPITYGLSLIMILTTSGLPPFAAFFSKGLVITSITEAGNLWQIILIYATTALTFAYSLRFITLIFVGKESEHLEKLHPHEAPKMMLYPAAVLAVLCVAWGFIQPWLGSFMQVPGEMSLLGSFLSLETPIFFAILVPVGLIIYLTYYKHSEIMMKIRSSSNPFSVVLKHAYFFDDLYERVIVRGIVKFSDGVRYVEVYLFNQLPQMVAYSVIVLANAVHRYLDVLADELLSVVAHRTLRSVSHMKRVPSSSLQHYIAAALLGFILILILIILTVGI
jgi:NADH-quinone oxidoreductase subunit L